MLARKKYETNNEARLELRCYLKFCSCVCMYVYENPIIISVPKLVSFVDPVRSKQYFYVFRTIPV